MAENRSCPSKSVLEEHAAALSPEKGQTAVEAHIKTCKRCSEKLQALAKEADALRQLLLQAEAPPGSTCPDSTVLAAYVDRALKPDQRSEVEAHAARCRECQQILKRIHQDTRDVVSEDSQPYLTGSGPEPVKLAGRKRSKRRDPLRTKPKQIEADNADVQTRKKRLSSDYD